jgi:hypothetical protein
MKYTYILAVVIPLIFILTACEQQGPVTHTQAFLAVKKAYQENNTEDSG